MTSNEIKIQFRYKELIKEVNLLKKNLFDVQGKLKNVEAYQEIIIQKEVKERTKNLETKHKNEIKDKDKIIKDKDNQIEALKIEITKLLSKMNNDSSNSGIPTSKTSINKKKYIPNTREKTDKPIGGQQGHSKHKLKAFSEEEATEIIEEICEECPKCGSTNIKKTEKAKNKCETDYEVKIIKRLHKFIECECENCHANFHKEIPKNLKEENQYGATVQALSVCLTNEVFTPFNKTTKLISGITENNINISEGYVAKLQKKASKLLEPFQKEIEEYIIKQPVYGWDEGIISINTKQGILRTYCTDKVSLFYASESKSKDSVDEDNILFRTAANTVVMHDHNLISYHEDYNFKNVECFIHLNRRILKMYQNTNNNYLEEMKKLLTKTNSDRNELIEKKEEKFSDNYIKTFEKKFDKLLEEGKKVNASQTLMENPFKEEEATLLKDIEKYKKNYLLWVYNFCIPSHNNTCERAIRPAKSKMKISGHFKNIQNAEYFAIIRSYIQTCKINGINILLACEALMNGFPYTLEDILGNSKND